MTYEIYSYGSGEIITSLFNAIAMAAYGEGSALLYTMKAVGLMVGTVMTVFLVIYGKGASVFSGWLLPAVGFMTVLCIPQASVWIHDPAHRFHQKVDHVPYGLAMIAGSTSKLGHSITEYIEKIFTLPDDLKYQRSGMVFGAELMQKAKTFRITHQDLSENMRGFVTQCIMYTALRGRKYTLQDLRHSDDIWGLVSSNASPVASFLWKDPRKEGEEGARPIILTCKEGVTKFNQFWKQEIDQAYTKYGVKIFGHRGMIDPKVELMRYLPLTYETLGKVAKSASETMMQQMMIHGIMEGIETQSTMIGNAPNWAQRKAYLQQKSTMETIGGLVGNVLVTMKAIIEALTYVSFLFIIPLILLPYGYRVLSSWIQTLVWLQAWAPLYAVLNMIMTAAATSKTTAMLSTSNPSGVTIASVVGLAEVNHDIAAMAGYLSLSIPFLSIAIVKGLGSMVHLAGSLTGATMSAASAGAAEAVSGNISMGNITQGVSQIHNASMGQRHLSPLLQSGAFGLHDGIQSTTTTADGTQIVNVATSSGAMSFSHSKADTSHLSQMASHSLSHATQMGEAYSKQMGSVYKDIIDLSNHLSHSTHAGDQVNQGFNTEQVKGIHTTAQMIDKWGESHGINKNQRAEVFAGITAGISLGGLEGNGIGIKGGINGSLGASQEQAISSARDILNNKEFQEAVRQSEQFSHNQSFSQGDEEGKRLSEGISRGYEMADTFRQSAEKNFRQAEEYQSQESLASRQETIISSNLMQDFKNWMAEQPSYSASKGKMGRSEANTILFNENNRSLASEYAGQFLQTRGLIPTASVNVSNQGNHLKGDYDHNTSHQIADTSFETAEVGMQSLKKSSGLNAPNRSAVKARVEQETIQNQDSIDHQHGEITAAQKKLKTQYDQTKQKDLTKITVEHLGEVVIPDW